MTSKATLLQNVVYTRAALTEAKESVAKLEARLGELEASIHGIKHIKKTCTSELIDEWAYPGENGHPYPEGWVKQWEDADFTPDFDLETKFRVDGPPRAGGSVNLIYCTQTGGCCSTPGDALAGIFIQTTEDNKLYLCVVVGTNYSNQLVYLTPSNYEDPAKVAFDYGEEMTVLIKARGDKVFVSYKEFEAQIAAYCPGEERVGGVAQVYTPGPPFVPITGVIHSAKLTTYS